MCYLILTLRVILTKHFMSISFSAVNSYHSCRIRALDKDKFIGAVPDSSCFVCYVLYATITHINIHKFRISVNLAVKLIMGL